jgi:hypothetical protein
MNFKGQHCWEKIGEKHEAEGGNSYVYKVSGLNDKEYALKLFKFENRQGERYERFISEIEVVKELAGINGCVSCIDHGFY